jgi:hypothetical protein
MVEGTDVEAYEPASARNMPRSQSSLGARVKKDIGKLTVSLLGDVGTAPTLGDVEKFNKRGEGESRTPLMTVVQAVLAKAGGSMQLGDLATQTRKYWHRPFPKPLYRGRAHICCCEALTVSELASVVPQECPYVTKVDDTGMERPAGRFTEDFKHIDERMSP